MSEIKTIEDLQKLVRDGVVDFSDYGEVSTAEYNGMILFNYRATAQEWNPFELMSRGLILNRETGEIVARPFDKFFNWDQYGRTTAAAPKIAYEKMDGSLGILYRDPARKDYAIATRGSFTSEQAQWATSRLKAHDTSFVAPDWTLLFEIIYPENRVVVDYGEFRGLYLLAIRNRHTGDYMSWGTVREVAKQCGFMLPFVFPLSRLSGLSRFLEGAELREGYVVEFMDGQRFKFKTELYLRLHYLRTNLTFKRVLEAYRDKNLDQFLEGVPDEFRNRVDEYIDEIESVVRKIRREVDDFMCDPDIDFISRKDFATRVFKTHSHLSKYLFAALDERDYTDLIYKTAFKDRSGEEKVSGMPDAAEFFGIKDQK